MTAPTEQRKLAAIVFTDMVGYSALAQRNEALALELLEEHRHIVRDILPKHGGREVKTTGDGFLIEFLSALAAVRCAATVQQAFHNRNQIQPTDRQVRLRIGIHVGDVVERDGDIHGDGVNIAARLEPLADPGGICVSEDVARQIRNKLEHPLASIGPASLKHIDLPVVAHRIVLPWEERQPPELGERRTKLKPDLLASLAGRWVWVGVAAVLTLGAGWWLWHQRGNKLAGRTGAPFTGRIESLAVLPLENLSRDPTQEFFSDGMTDELITELQKIGAWRVISRTTMMRYKQTTKSLPEIARELNADGIVTGTVLRGGEKIRITTQLFHGPTDQNLWAESYLRDGRDGLTLQSEVALAIAGSIHVKLTPEEQTRLTRPHPVNPAAQEAYFRGREQWLHFTPQSFQAAIEFCNQAIRLDTNFAKAYAQLGACYNANGTMELLWPKDAFAKAREHLDTSLKIEETDTGRSHLAALQQFYDWDWPGAVQNIKRALELNKSDGLHYATLSGYLTLRRRFDEALTEARRGADLEPYSPVVTVMVGHVLFFGRHFAEAINDCQNRIKVSPDSLILRTTLAYSLMASGQDDQAVTAFQEALRLQRAPLALGGLGAALARFGRKDDARQILKELQELRAEAERTRQSYVSPYNLAMTHIGLGENSQALDWLEKGFEERTCWMEYLGVDPRLDGLRQEPRFQKLVEKMNFPR